MIVGEWVLYPRDKLMLVAAVGGDPPDSLDDLRRECDGLALLKDLQVLVTNHVEEHRVERLITRRQMRGEPARSDQHVVGVGEIAVVLTVDKQQIDATYRRTRLQRIGHPQQDRGSG